MRSSASTPGPLAEGRIPLFLVVVGDDHPRACTGRRLLRTGRVEELSSRQRPSKAPLLLDPHAVDPLAPWDRVRAETAGLLGVDCSWNALERRGGYPTTIPWLERLGARRRLPWLLAGNPQHFGRLAELNTAEALAAALHILGEPDRAAAILGGFAGGSAFLELNQEALESYRRSSDADSVRSAESKAMQRGWFAPRGKKQRPVVGSREGQRSSGTG